MPIICPSCEASYQIPPEAIGAGRQVRCRKCRAEWFVAGEAEAPLEAAPLIDDADDEWRETLPEPILGLEDASAIDVLDRPGSGGDLETIDVAAAPARIRRRRGPPLKALAARGARLLVAKDSRFKVRASAVAAALGVAAIGVLIGERVAIVRAAPSLASLYATVGLPVNVRGLAIRELRSVEDAADGAPILVVSGLVENVSDADLDVPRLRLAVTASGGREIYAWTTMATRSKLAPGETSAFRARLASPPAEGQAIAVRFIARRDAMASLGR